jgi:hypothetical protein
MPLIISLRHQQIDGAGEHFFGAVAANDLERQFVASPAHPLKGRAGVDYSFQSPAAKH